jgi:hypothetical protein
LIEDLAQISGERRETSAQAGSREVTLSLNGSSSNTGSGGY